MGKKTMYEEILEDFTTARYDASRASRARDRWTAISEVANAAREAGLSTEELRKAINELGTATIRRAPRRAGMLMVQLFHQDIGSLEMRETTYPGYSHAMVAMSSEMWEVVKVDGPPFGLRSAVQVTNREAITFPECAGSTLQFRVTHFGITTMEGITVHVGELSAPLTVTQGNTPEFSPGSIEIEEDGFSKWYDIF